MSKVESEMESGRISIMSPFDKESEALPLIEAGATELYGGIFPSYFDGYPAFLAPNQRTFREAQMDEAGFARVVDTCHRHGVRSLLTINNAYFLPEQVPLIVRMARDAAAMGVDGFIMGSVPLILAVNSERLGVPIHLSTMGVALNHETVRFYNGLGIRRVTLPRSLSIAEMASIVNACPGTVFDAFVLIGKCPNVEGFCTLLHTNPDKVWPCEQCYDITAEGEGMDDAAAVQRQWQGFARSWSCGVCALKRLADAGIRGFKIVGRGGATPFKLANVKMVKDAIALLASEPDERNACAALKGLYAARFGKPCTPQCCYYPEMF